MHAKLFIICEEVFSSTILFIYPGGVLVEARRYALSWAIEWLPKFIRIMHYHEVRCIALPNHSDKIDQNPMKSSSQKADPNVQEMKHPVIPPSQSSKEINLIFCFRVLIQQVHV